MRCDECRKVIDKRHCVCERCLKKAAAVIGAATALVLSWEGRAQTMEENTLRHLVNEYFFAIEGETK